MFSVTSVDDAFACMLIHPDVSFFAPPDDANIVSESTEVFDVSPSITTNIIGQQTDDPATDMCERSCEELSVMFQELKGLRVVVSNLIDGLQKVVSSRCKVVCLFETSYCLRWCAVQTNCQWWLWNCQNLLLCEGRNSTLGGVAGMLNVWIRLLGY